MSETKKHETLLRAGIARGVVGKVDFDNRIIHGVALVTEGEAKGHGVSLDREFVQTTVTNGNKKKLGLKSRFGHPNMSSTAFGTAMGRTKSHYVDDSGEVAVARGDLHLSESARKSPQFAQDPVEYLLELADKDPDQFGLSIVFNRGPRYRRDAKGKKVFRYRQDGSYNESYDKADPKEYVEQKDLSAVDSVDSPAANEDGLFSAFSERLTAEVITEFLDSNPKIWEMLQDDDIEDIFSAFRERYAAYKEVAGSGAAPASTEPEPETHEKENPMSEKSTKETVKKFTSAFGAEKACEYLSDELTFEAATAVHAQFKQAEQAKELTEANEKVESLSAEVETLKADAQTAATQIASLKKGGDSLPSGDAGDGTGEGQEEGGEQLSARDLAQAKVDAGECESMTSALSAVYAEHPELNHRNADNQ